MLLFPSMWKHLSILPFVLLCLSVNAEEGIITAATWAQPRHGEWLLQQEGIATAVRALQRSPDARLQLRHPGGDEGALWAGELEAWLIALGVPSSRIDSIPGSASADSIQLHVQH